MTSVDNFDKPVRRAYRDPTADTAIGHIMREEKQKAKQNGSGKLTRRQKTKIRTKANKEKGRREAEADENHKNGD